MTSKPKRAVLRDNHGHVTKTYCLNGPGMPQRPFMGGAQDALDAIQTQLAQGRAVESASLYSGGRMIGRALPDGRVVRSS